MVINQPVPTFDVVALGHATHEMLAWVDRYPGSGDGIFSERVRWTGGGMSGNLAHAVARLGGKAALVTALGDDNVGDQTLSQLQQAGVDTSYIQRRQNAASPITILMINPLLERAGLVTDLPSRLRIRGDEVPDDLLLSTRVFFTDMEPAQAAIDAAHRAKSLGVPIAFDLQLAPEHANISGHKDNIAELFSLSDYFFADEENFLFWQEARNLDEALTVSLSHRPETTFVITRGGRGSLIATSNQQLHIPVFEIDIVDSIGAGDAYHAAFLYTHLALGWELQRAGTFASATAALSCRRAGGRDGLPDKAEVDDFLAFRGANG